MKKASSATTANKVREIEPFDKRSVNLAKFKSDINAKNWKTVLGVVAGGAFPPLFLFPIETISPAKTVGRGRTNLTLVRSTVFQTDAIPPRASFDRRLTPARNPTAQVHFEPSAYGIASVSTYIISFKIQVFGQGTFNLSGFAGLSPILNGGTKVLSGQTTVSLVLKDVSPAQQTFAFLEQTAGAPWDWFSTQISFPPPVITQDLQPL